MVVNHLSTSTAGGAAVAARRLHHGLQQIGVQSRFWHLNPRSKVAGDGTYHTMKWRDETGSTWRRIGRDLLAASKKPLQKRKLRQALSGRPDGLELFTSPYRTRSTACPANYLTGEVIHLHWISNLIDYPSFFASIPNEYPVVWSLHDMNPLTGGCHYSSGCERYTTGCQHCPQLGSPTADDLSHQFFQAKRHALQNKNLHVVANSKWMEHQVRRSEMLKTAHSFRTIHYCLDTELFRPQDKSAARRQLGLHDRQPIIAFGAESWKYRRKGFHELLAAIPLVQEILPATLLTFGNPAHLPTDATSLPDIKVLGFVNDSQRLSQIYSAADLFVLPSLEEALGQTGIEAMSCGTPVVAFHTGGLPDYVQPLKTGLLAESGSACDLARQMIWPLQRPAQAKQMGQRARLLVQNQFDITTQATKYRQLYEQVMTAKLPTAKSQ